MVGEDPSITTVMKEFFLRTGRCSGTDLSLEVRFCGDSVRLDRLYEVVESYGGFEEVRKNFLMNKVGKAIGISIPAESAVCGLDTALESLYERCVLDFSLWYKGTNARGRGDSLNKRRTSCLTEEDVRSSYNVDAVSEHIFEFCERQRKLAGINCIITSLASGYPNEVDATLNALLEFTRHEKSCKILCEMENLFVLLPAVIGVFNDCCEASSCGCFNYLFLVPHIRESTKIWAKNTGCNNVFLPRNTSFEIQEDLVNHEKKVDAEPEKTFRTRLNIILTIIYNLGCDELELSSCSPTFKLLVFGCRFSDFSVVKSCWEILENLCRRVTLGNDCPIVTSFIESLEVACKTKSRNIICHALHSLIDILSSEKNTSCSLYLGNFNVVVLVELLSVCDSKVSLLSLMSLQLLTLRGFSLSTSNLLYVDMIAAHTTPLYLGFDPFTGERILRVFGHRLSTSCRSNDTKTVNHVPHRVSLVVEDWLRKNYVRDEPRHATTVGVAKGVRESESCVTLYDVMLEFYHHSTCDRGMEASEVSLGILRILELYDDYTVLLAGTLRSSLRFNSPFRTFQLLGRTCFVRIPLTRKQGVCVTTQEYLARPSAALAKSPIDKSSAFVSTPFVWRPESCHSANAELLLMVQASRVHTVNCLKNSASQMDCFGLSLKNGRDFVQAARMHGPTQTTTTLGEVVPPHYEELGECQGPHFGETDAIETLNGLVEKETASKHAGDEGLTDNQCSENFIPKYAMNTLLNLCWKDASLARYVRERHLEDMIRFCIGRESLYRTLSNFV